MKIEIRLSWKVMAVLAVIAAIVGYSNTSYTTPPNKELYRELKYRKIYKIDEPQGVLVNSSVRG